MYHNAVQADPGSSTDFSSRVIYVFLAYKFKMTPLEKTIQIGPSRNHRLPKIQRLASQFPASQPARQPTSQPAWPTEVANWPDG